MTAATAGGGASSTGASRFVAILKSLWNSVVEEADDGLSSAWYCLLWHVDGKRNVSSRWQIPPFAVLILREIRRDTLPNPTYRGLRRRSTERVKRGYL